MRNYSGHCEKAQGMKRNMRTRKPKKRKPKAKIKLMVLAAAAVLLVVFALSPLSKYLVSLSVMSVYSGVHERQSIMEDGSSTLAALKI